MTGASNSTLNKRMVEEADEHANNSVLVVHLEVGAGNGAEEEDDEFVAEEGEEAKLQQRQLRHLYSRCDV